MQPSCAVCPWKVFADMNGSVVLRRNERLVLVTLCVLVAAMPWPVAAQQGYAIRGNQVVVNQARHWRVWSGASSLVRISPTEGITPLLVRKNVNAALDATNFASAGTGGVKVASNESTRLNVIDGDMATTWGPHPRAPLRDWWLELHLGRLVVVEKIVIHFAEAGEGEPARMAASTSRAGSSTACRGRSSASSSTRSTTRSMPTSWDRAGCSPVSAPRSWRASNGRRRCTGRRSPCDPWKEEGAGVLLRAGLRVGARG